MKTTKYKGTKKETGALSAYVKLMRAAESVLARATRHLRDKGLTTSQFGVLEALYHLGPLSQREAAAKVLRTSGNMTLVIDNLVRRGLVNRERNEEDRRLYRLSLTQEGKKLMARLFPIHAKAIEREMAVIGPEEQRELGRICRILGKGRE
jgi:MarR family 2-MHQ and catechol resistance regulon transcriptional repressor